MKFVAKILRAYVKEGSSSCLPNVNVEKDSLHETTCVSASAFSWKGEKIMMRIRTKEEIVMRVVMLI
jgi:hypothetical protein